MTVRVGDRSLAELLQSLSGPTPPLEPSGVALAERLRSLVTTAVEVLGVDSVGLMLLGEDGGWASAASTDRPTATLEDVQAELCEGPGIDASRTGRVVAVADLEREVAYANLWRRVSEQGVRAVLACPVRVQGVVAGHLSCTRRAAHRWSAAEVQAAEAYAEVVGVALDLAVVTAGARRRASELHRLTHLDGTDEFAQHAASDGSR